MFVIISVIYRPIEQLLSRTIADHRARGIAGTADARADAIQGSFALVFLAVALPLHDELADHVFDHYAGALLDLRRRHVAYAASYFARGWLAGHKYFALYGGLVFMESASRIGFAIAAAVGITRAVGGRAGHRGGAVRLAGGRAGRVRASRAPTARPRAPMRRRRRRGPITVDEADAALAGPGDRGHRGGRVSDLSIRRGGGFAISVSGIKLAEQTLLNAAVLTVAATARTRALPGIVFNVLLITRAPLQLFQAIQTSLLPHLAGLEATRAARRSRARSA